LVYDMAGNLAEWCHDWFVRDLSGEPLTDPTGPTSGTTKAYRGGSYAAADTLLLRCASRLWAPPEQMKTTIGFRIVRTLRR